MKVLVIAPHPDDETLGCGGAVILHVRKGDRVVVAFLTSGELGLKHLPREKAWRIREREAENAAKILGLAEAQFLRKPDWTLGQNIEATAEALSLVMRQEQPELIYLPHEREWHPDHHAAASIVRLALKQTGLALPHLRAYEIWTALSEYDQVENITGVMPRKMRALRAHQSQLRNFDYARAIRGLNQYRGVMAGKCRYAEVFQTITG